MRTTGNTCIYVDACAERKRKYHFLMMHGGRVFIDIQTNDTSTPRTDVRGDLPITRQLGGPHMAIVAAI